MQGQVVHVVSYDIQSDRVRARIARRLEDLGVRVQKSVFELRGTAEVVRHRVGDLALMIEPGDSIRVYPLTPGSVERVEVYGAGVPPEMHDFHLL